MPSLDERIALAEKLIGSVALESEVFSSHLTVTYARLVEILAGEVTPVGREDTRKQVQEWLCKGSAASLSTGYSQTWKARDLLASSSG